jgi:DNA-binding NarL/FixJ family response regulator
MNVLILTAVRLFGDGLAACFNARAGIRVLGVVDDLVVLRELMGQVDVEVILIDVSQGIELFDVRGIAAESPNVALVALGVNERRQDVIECGRAGFCGYVGRNASVDSLCTSLSEIVAGRQACPPEITGALLRALHSRDARAEGPDPASTLTRRESEVATLVKEGLSNKEIGAELSLSVATVKHHVHNILEKLGLSGRFQVMQLMRRHPWPGRPPTAERKQLAP